jgi:hypothetical protein
MLRHEFKLKGYKSKTTKRVGILAFDRDFSSEDLLPNEVFAGTDGCALRTAGCR